MPLGFIVAYLARRGPLLAVLLGLGASVLIEVTQFTALWGRYPCPYRQADLDDLLLNTAGAALGWILGWLALLSER